MKQMSLSQAAAIFRRKVRPLVVVSDKKAIKALYVELTAAAGMQDGDQAIGEMERELRLALSEPNRRVRRNVFPSLFTETKERNGE